MDNNQSKVDAIDCHLECIGIRPKCLMALEEENIRFSLLTIL